MWQIIGAGAIGCLWATNLLRDGQQVTLITRKNSQTQTLNYQDLQGKRTSFNCRLSTQLSNRDDPILVCVKAPQVKQALLQHRHNISEQQAIILMHNGMGTAEQVTKIFPHNPIICATTTNASLLNAELNIIQTGKGATYLGAFNEQGKSFSILANKLNSALDDTLWCEDIKQKLWLKLLINIAINPLTAIFKVNNGTLAKKHFQRQIAQMINEVMPVLEKEGLLFESHMLLITINNVIQATAANYSSMNRDIYFKRPTENEYISGYLLKKALQYNIETPLIRSLYEQIKEISHQVK
ncbi:ketopantoate reductase family protein [Psychromonas hadalis]|uniref:ketopantoate reductase family protein n=1 Tax=Psychromonas hadalis TaxID=211669 RepID=UPI0003B54B6B|nr:2-dehydropantoate 2-reductase [Psychromonas hadalis]